MRIAFVALLALSCTRPPPPRPPPPPPKLAARAPEEPPAPFVRLAAAKRSGGAIEAPFDFIGGRPAYDGAFPTPAYSLEERWVFGSPVSVCRSAFYDHDVQELHGTHAVWTELTQSLAGDDRFKESKLARDGMRFTLRRERFCIYHECKPPLSAPSTTLDVCDDLATVKDPVAVVRAMIGHLPVLTGHDEVFSIAGVSPASVTYRRDGSARDEAEVRVSAAPDARELVRKFLVERGLAVRDPNIPWAMNSTDKKRSYLFYPDTTSTTVTFSGRSGP